MADTGRKYINFEVPTQNVWKTREVKNTNSAGEDYTMSYRDVRLPDGLKLVDIEGKTHVAGDKGWSIKVSPTEKGVSTSRFYNACSRVGLSYSDDYPNIRCQASQKSVDGTWTNEDFYVNPQEFEKAMLDWRNENIVSFSIPVECIEKVFEVRPKKEGWKPEQGFNVKIPQTTGGDLAGKEITLYNLEDTIRDREGREHEAKLKDGTKYYVAKSLTGATISIEGDAVYGDEFGNVVNEREYIPVEDIAKPFYQLMGKTASTEMRQKEFALIAAAKAAPEKGKEPAQAAPAPKIETPQATRGGKAL